jgi:hypothetical protein
MAGVMDRVRRAFNAFTPQELDSNITQFRPPEYANYGTSFSTRPDRVSFRISNERSLITSIYTRIAIDAATVQLKHVRLDDQDRYLQDIDSGLNSCLTLEANVDQAARHFRQDIIMSMCDKGVIAVVPIDTTLDPQLTTGFDILTMRVGEIVQWYPKHVKVSVWNEVAGKRQELVLPKSLVAIVENPLFAVMNEPNSTLQRLLRKLSLLDNVDEASASGKLDLIIQLPYVIKSEARKQQAEQRRNDIEFQLKGSKYGIAYTDGTEKITQLNRPVENNLMGQIEYLTTLLYGQLGITAAVMNGTASEAEMLNYWNRTIEPMLGAVAEAMKRTFLTKTARSQKQSITYFRDPFKLVPLSQMAEIADKFARNEILTSNEVRQAIGMRPAGDPKADMLVNSNMPQGEGMVPKVPVTDDTEAEPENVEEDDSDPDAEANGILNQAFDGVDSTLDELYKTIGVEE